MNLYILTTADLAELWIANMDTILVLLSVIMGILSLCLPSTSRATRGRFAFSVTTEEPPAKDNNMKDRKSVV